MTILAIVNPSSPPLPPLLAAPLEKAPKMEAMGSEIRGSEWSKMLKESLTLSVVNEDSSELVNRDQSLDVASE